uniref:RNA-directed DNA polymerase n=1 Tax=Glypta fumiferanae TaxID=389681 RepID=A0A0F6Q721_9HYME|nr:pol polyprotein [Glypta fumiferanae]
MVGSNEFEKFATAVFAEMGLDRTLGRGRGCGSRQSLDGNVPGRVAAPRTSSMATDRDAHEDGHVDAPLGTDAHATANEQPPLRTNENDGARASRDGSNDGVNTSHASTSTGGNVPPHPPTLPGGNSTLNGAANVNAPLVAAFRNLLTNENRDEALAQLFAGLVTSQQQVAPLASGHIPTYHVIPDLSRNIENFSGEDDGVRAIEWIENLESMKRLHEWREEFIMEAARMNLTGAARDWYRGRSRELRTWKEFSDAFRDTFIVTDDKSTQWARMKERVQGKSESIVKYFHAKVRLCAPLRLTFREEKAEVIMGLWSRELCNTVMATTQYTYDELLHDLLYYERVMSQRAERIRSDRGSSATKTKRHNESTSATDQDKTKNTSDKRKDNATSRVPSNGPRKCYNCDKEGHMSRDCSEPKREPTCYKCNKKGHISRDCVSNTEKTVRTLGQFSDSSSNKYMKTASVNGREISVFIDTGSSECTIRSTRVLLEQFPVINKSAELKGFGPPEFVVSSPGIITATISIDGVEVRDVVMRIVPDNVQPVDAIIGRTFTDQPYVEYHKVGNTLTFRRADELSTEIDPVITNPTALQAAALPPRSISFVNMATNEESFTVPIYNLSTDERKINVGETSLVRGEVHRVPILNDNVSEMRKINIDDIDIGPEQPESVKRELHELINEYRDCVSTSLQDLGCATDIEMDIQVSDTATPVFSKPYRATEKERGEIKQILGEWRDAGIVTDTQSPYASPVLLVKKKTGESRLCVDFRKLNQQTKRVHFPLPNIDDHLSKIRDSSLFIVLDLAHGYLQIPLTRDAREKTAIITSDETAEFTRMVFGLMNGPAFFSKAMHKALGSLRDDVALYYLDDILIPGKNWADLKDKLCLVLDALRNAGLTIKLAKCKFLYREVSYLGYEITENGIGPGYRKVEAIKEFAVPKNVHEIRRYLGLTSYFRKFVPKFAEIAGPLHELLRSNVEFRWGQSQQDAFETLKRKLTEHPILQTFDPRAVTELHTDASAVGLAAMLMQRDSNGKMRLVYALSRRTSEVESRYHSSKLELLAIIWAITRLRSMLANIHFTVVTDCQALCYLSTQKTLNPQMIRWNNLLSEYDYNIVHREGVKLAHVDALSRAPVEAPENAQGNHVLSINNEADAIRMYQYSDDVLKRKKELLTKGIDTCSKIEKSEIEGFELIDGILYKRCEDKLLYVVPKSMRKSLVIRFHDLKSHQGVDRTVSRIKEHYHFPRMRTYVKRHIRSCLHCTACKAKPGRQAGELHPIPPGHRPFATIHVDHMGPFVTSARGNKYVFVIVDNLTKFVIVRAVKNTKTVPVLRILDEFVREYGAPLRIVSDRGTCFTSKQFEQFCDKHGIRHTLNSPRHPQANGQVERWNATLLPAIQGSLIEDEGKSWDMQIRKIQSDLNEMKNASTGKSPFELVYGYVPRRDEGTVRQLAVDEDKMYQQPEKLQNEAKICIESAQQRYKKRYDENRIKNVDFEVGSIVYMRTVPIATGESTKLQPKYRGPLVVTRKIAGDTYHVCDLDDSEKGRRYASTAHASQLKLWKPVSDESDYDSDSTNSDRDSDVIEMCVKANKNDTTTRSDTERTTQKKSRESNVSERDSTIESAENDQLATAVRRPRRSRQRPVRLNDYEME